MKNCFSPVSRMGHVRHRPERDQPLVDAVEEEVVRAVPQELDASHAPGKQTMIISTITTRPPIATLSRLKRRMTYSA